jgi:hypothetical protein
MRIRTRQEAPTKKPLDRVQDSSLASPAELQRLEQESSQPISANAEGSGHSFGTLSVDGARPKLTVSQPTDAAEQEAARVADQVAGRARDIPSPAEQPVERIAASADLSRGAASSFDGPRGDGTSSEVETLTTQALAGTGDPLSGSVRREMETAFGHDFSQVRVHTGDAASRSARAVNASAFTVGSDVVFGAGRYAPGTRDGSRLIAHELTHVVQNSAASANSASVLSRDVEVPPAPLTFNAPAEKEKDAFPEPDKERARAMVIGPLRAAAAQLGKGEKADVPSVIRHLRPMRAAAAGVKWPDSVRDEVMSILDGISIDRTLLESLKLSDRQAVVAARKNWADARRELAAVRKAINAAEPDPKKNPDATPREGSNRDVNAVLALSGQIEATTTDLIKAPRTQEGFKTVLETAAGLLAMFDTVKPEEDANGVARAKENFTLGLANIAPLALGKEESLKQVQKDLNDAADRLAGFVGDAAPAPDTGEPGKDDQENQAPPDPKADPAPSPNPLPPPPPPPPGAGSGSRSG